MCAKRSTSARRQALYVVAHHTVQYGMLSLEEFCEICHAKGVPVIVDAASEYDLRGFLARGADIVIYSGHKFLSRADQRHRHRPQGSGARRLSAEPRRRARP